MAARLCGRSLLAIYRQILEEKETTDDRLFFGKCLSTANALCRTSIDQWLFVSYSENRGLNAGHV